MGRGGDTRAESTAAGVPEQLLELELGVNNGNDNEGGGGSGGSSDEDDDNTWW